MIPEFQKPQVTEIHVRMDCNGCVQKIKKALSGINGIYDLYIDFPQQKITIIGWTDPEKIVKAIKKTRKIATICNIEPSDESPSQPAEASSSQPTEPEGNAQNPEATQTQPQPAQVPSEPPQDTPNPEQPPHDTTPSPTKPEENNNSPIQQTPRTKDFGEAHVISHNPPNYGNRFGSYGHNYVNVVGEQCRNRYHNSSAFLQEPPQQPVYVTHSYNTYRPSPYVTEYDYLRSPPRHTHYNRMEYYSGDYQNGNGNITSMFSDENPNACRIV